MFEFLRNYYQIVSLSEAIEMLRTNSVRRPTVVLTVDDGYGENFLTLRAIRERLSVPMTLFVSTEILNRQGQFPHDVRHGNEGWQPLSWDQLRQLQREGFEIGSHTRTHFDCGSTDVNVLYDEIAGSKYDLQRQLGIPIELFSFPFGLPANISAEAMKIALETYPYVFSAYGGSNFASMDGEVRHFKRWAHPNDIWELELALQGILEKPHPVHGRRVSQTLPDDPSLAGRFLDYSLVIPISQGSPSISHFVQWSAPSRPTAISVARVSDFTYSACFITASWMRSEARKRIRIRSVTSKPASLRMF